MKRAFTIKYYRKDFFGFHEYTEDYIAAVLMEDKHTKKAWDAFTKDSQITLTTDKYCFSWDKYGDRENGVVTVYEYAETGTGYDVFKMDKAHAKKLFTEDAQRAKEEENPAA